MNLRLIYPSTFTATPVSHSKGHFHRILCHTIFQKSLFFSGKTWCREPESNRHDGYPSQDFKSWAPPFLHSGKHTQIRENTRKTPDLLHWNVWGKRGPLGSGCHTLVTWPAAGSGPTCAQASISSAQICAPSILFPKRTHNEVPRPGGRSNS